MVLFSGENGQEEVPLQTEGGDSLDIKNIFVNLNILYKWIVRSTGHPLEWNSHVMQVQYTKQKTCK